PWQPRMFFKSTSFENDRVISTIDTAIGGELGLVRWCFADHGPRTRDAIQLDVFAVVFSRFSDNSTLVGDDYRFGFPITFAHGPWEGKLGYEHTSTHIGDDFIRQFLQFKKGYIRDEFVLGLAYRWWEQFRVYSQFGYACHLTTPGSNDTPFRCDFGIEWSRQQTTGVCGQPFAAFDIEMRADTGYDPYTTLQVGWQWKNMETGHSLRAGAEYFNGPSPFGQFF